MKRFTIVFSPNALDDIEQAVIYYEQNQQDLGSRFISQLQNTLNSIDRNPFFASVRYNNIRCATLKKFPYLVHYYVDDSKKLVTIGAVYSTYKQPLT